MSGKWPTARRQQSRAAGSSYKRSFTTPLYQCSKCRLFYEHLNGDRCDGCTLTDERKPK